MLNNKLWRVKFPKRCQHYSVLVKKQQRNFSIVIYSIKKSKLYLDQDYDEAELEKELEELKQQRLDNERLGVNATAQELPVDDIKMPIVANKDKKGNFICSKKHYLKTVISIWIIFILVSSRNGIKRNC